MQAYCVKCRTKREIKDAKSITMKNGKPATQGTCPVCGTKMFRIGKSQVFAGIASGIRRRLGFPSIRMPSLLFSPNVMKLLYEYHQLLTQMASSSWDKLQKFLEFLNTETCICYDSTHGISVDGVCSGYSDNPFPICHRDMLALSRYPETGFLKSLYSPLMIYPWQAGHNSTRPLHNGLLCLYLIPPQSPNTLVQHP